MTEWFKVGVSIRTDISNSWDVFQIIRSIIGTITKEQVRPQVDLDFD